MNHIDPDQLAALAIDADDEQVRTNAHLAACARCRGELQTLRDVTGRARDAGRADPLPMPPEGVWDSVVRELTATGDLDPTPARAPARWQPWAYAAAIVLIAVFAALALLPVAGEDVVATATLAPLAEVTEARAEVVADGDRRTLSVDDLDLPPIDGYYELWLLTTSGDGLISLGPVGREARVDVPATIDINRFSVVDISREPPDGDPAHSADSVLRGPLQPQA